MAMYDQYGRKISAAEKAKRVAEKKAREAVSDPKKRAEMFKKQVARREAVRKAEAAKGNKAAVTKSKPKAEMVKTQKKATLSRKVEGKPAAGTKKVGTQPKGSNTTTPSTPVKKATPSNLTGFSVNKPGSVARDVKHPKGWRTSAKPEKSTPKPKPRTKQSGPMTWK